TVFARRRLLEGIAVRDRPVLGLAVLRAPAPTRNAQLQGDIQRRPVHSALATRYEPADHRFINSFPTTNPTASTKLRHALAIVAELVTVQRCRSLTTSATCALRCSYLGCRHAG